MSLTSLEHLLAMSVGHRELRRANHQVGEAVSVSREEASLFEPAEVYVVLQQRNQILKAAVILFALVRRCGQQQ